MNHVTVDDVCYDKPVNNSNEPFITISLSKEAAQALADICGAVGGLPTDTPRKHFDAILDALWAKGLEYSDSSTGFGDYPTQLTFKDYPK